MDLRKNRKCDFGKHFGNLGNGKTGNFVGGVVQTERSYTQYAADDDVVQIVVKIIENTGGGEPLAAMENEAKFFGNKIEAGAGFDIQVRKNYFAN